MFDPLIMNEIRFKFKKCSFKLLLDCTLCINKLQCCGTTFVQLIHYKPTKLCMCVCVCVDTVPDTPRFFRINRRNLDTLYLEWDKPLEPNGILIGYQLKYLTGELQQIGQVCLMSLHLYLFTERVYCYTDYLF